jgi:hypothetical protein
LEVLFPRRQAPPRFPDRCVVCGRDHPPTTALLFATVPGATGRPIDSYSVIVPCCWKCSIALHARRLGRPLLLFILLIALTIYAFVHAQSRGGYYLIVAAPLALVAVILALLRRLYPPRFDLTAGLDAVTFTFHDLSLGYEFRALNPQAHHAGGLTSA